MIDDIVFTAYNAERDITYTLYEGEPNSYGWLHIIHQRPYMSSRLNALKYAIENPDVAIWDSLHSENGDRERIYCLGAYPPRPNMNMVVIATYTDSSNGSITTAWQTPDAPPTEGVVTYAKPTEKTGV